MDNKIAAVADAGKAKERKMSLKTHGNGETETQFTVAAVLNFATEGAMIILWPTWVSRCMC